MTGRMWAAGFTPRGPQQWGEGPEDGAPELSLVSGSARPPGWGRALREEGIPVRVSMNLQQETVLPAGP